MKNCVFHQLSSLFFSFLVLMSFFLCNSSFASHEILTFTRTNSSLQKASDILALPKHPAGTKGTLTIDIRWKARQVSPREFKDLTIIDRHTTIVCPIVTGDEQSTSLMSGPTSAQEAAHHQLAQAAKESIESLPNGAIEQMASLEKKMKACRKAGGSEQSCGMQMVMEMQKNPINIIPREKDTQKREAAEAAVDAVALSILPWFNEGCKGQMTLNDSRKLDDPTIAGEEPTIHTTGTQKIDTSDTLITVETDLEKGSTRYMFVSPEASGFIQEAGYGQKETKVSASAMPESVVIVGPITGPLQNGTHRYKYGEHEVVIEWTFADK